MTEPKNEFSWSKTKDEVFKTNFTKVSEKKILKIS
jgi:hypothetical protein